MKGYRVAMALAGVLLANCIAQAATDWTTFGNGPAHTGYTNVTLGSAPLKLSWTAALSDKALWQPVIANGRVYVSHSAYFTTATVTAVELNTGVSAWSYTLPASASVNPITYDNGSIYLQTIDGSSNGLLWKFNAASGAVTWTAPFGCQWENYFAPTAADGAVFIDGGDYGGLYGFRQTDGVQLFFNSQLEQYDKWTPTWSNGKLYTFIAGKFREHNPSSGAINWAVDVGWTWNGWSMDRVVAVADGKAYFCGSSNLYAVDLTTKAQAWYTSGSFSGTPAVANGVVYALSGDSIRAYDAVTGAFLRTYQADTVLRYQPIVTNDCVLAASSSATYVFSLATGTQIQRIATGGYLAVSDDAVYIAGNGGNLQRYLKTGTNPPVIDSLTADGNPVQLPATTSLRVGAHDPSADPAGLCYSYKVLSGPGTATFTPNGTAASSVSSVEFSAAGTYLLEARVTNSTGIDYASISVVVLPEVVISSVSASPSLVSLPSPSTLTVVAEDANAPGSPLAYAWTKISGPGTVVFAPNIPSSDPTATANFDRPGVYTLQVAVSNGHAETKAELKVTVVRSRAAGNWVTFGAGPDHTGYVGGALQATSLDAAWAVSVGSRPLNQPAVVDNRVYVTPSVYFTTADLTALDLNSGTQVWNYAFASSARINPPTYEGGSIYMQRIDTSANGTLIKFNAATGSVVWTAPFGCQWENYYAPTLADGAVFVDGGTYGGLYGFRQTDGAQLFFNGQLEQYDEWTPTYSNGKLYTFIAGKFREHNASSGTINWTLNVGWSWNGWSMDRVVAVADGKAYFCGSSNLYAVDLTTKAQAWCANGAFSGTPAAANGVVYVLAGNSIRSYDATTGAFLRAYQADTAVQYQPILTDDCLIAASSSATYVFDLASTNLIRKIPYGGYVAVAGRAVYIAGSDGSLRKYGGSNSVPTNTDPPAVTGAYWVGQALSTSSGTWTDADGDTLFYSYQWQRAIDAAGTGLANIANATAATYLLTSTEAHKFVRVTVSASDHCGGLVPVSTPWVLVDNSSPANAAAPTITGAVEITRTVSAAKGTWLDADGDSLSYSYQWFRAADASGSGANAIVNATASSYALSSLDLFSYIGVRITASDGHAGLGTAFSAYVQVLKCSQTITFPPLTAKVFGAADFSPGATTSSGLMISYSSSDSGVATILNDQIHIVGAGQTTITASQAGDATYGAAGSVPLTLTIYKATPALTWANPAPIIYGTLLNATQLSATAGVPGIFSYTPAAGTKLAAGTGRTLSTTFTPADSANYNSVSASVTINVLKATPTITWPTPADIVYGTLLSATQLNATANTPGTFVYTPASGTKLAAGTGRTLSTTFAPTDTANYNSTTAAVTINILKATPVITWPTPADIRYGTPLGAAQLRATTIVPGTFVYFPAAGTILDVGSLQPLSTTFTPTDSANYRSASASVTINVVKATPSIMWFKPSDIVYGTALGAAQLNATVAVPGAFVYFPPLGTVLGAGNAQTLSATFTPDDTAHFTSATAAVIINVLTATPTITWANPDDITYGTTLSGQQLNATADVAGTFAYTPEYGTGLAAGTGRILTATFTPADSTNYSTTTATVTIDVLKATPSITWPNPDDIIEGTPLGATQLNATTNVLGSFTYTPGTGTILSLADGQTLTVLFAPDDSTNYTTATATTLINVKPAIAPAIISSLNVRAIRNSAFSYTIAATGSAPITFAADNLPPGLSLVGNLITGTPSVAGVFAVALKASNIVGSDIETLHLTITRSGASNRAPAFSSLPLASVSPAVAGEPVNFTAFAADDDGDTLAYSWDFGDGTGEQGAQISHVFATPGMYALTVTVCDGTSTIAQGMNVAVTAPGRATDNDDENGDGDSDGWAVGEHNAFEITRCALKFNFNDGTKDALLLGGTVPLPKFFAPANKIVTILIGGLRKDFTLSAAGSGITGLSKFHLSGPQKKGVFTFSPAKFVLSIKGEPLSAALKELGFTNKTTAKAGEHINMPVIIMVDVWGNLSSQDVLYRAVVNKRGLGQ